MNRSAVAGKSRSGMRTRKGPGRWPDDSAAATISISAVVPADTPKYFTVAEVSIVLDRARESCGGLDALAKRIKQVTGESVTFQHLSRMIRSAGKNGRDPQGAALEYLGFERCVLYRKIDKAGGK